MSSRTSSAVAGAVSKAAGRVRHATVSAAPASGSESSDFGRQIYVYTHLQTKQVVYSLKKGMKNNAVLRQIPYNGKKTVPAALRKDLWTPMALIEFPPSAHANATGQTVFRKLREYKILHETQWPLEIVRKKMTEKEIKERDERMRARGIKKWDKKEYRDLTKVERGRLLCDQRANSIADMAAALRTLNVVEDVGGEGTAETGGNNPIKATVKWTDVFDAEFAESWPEGVVHDKWKVIRNNRRAPPEFTEEIETVEEVRQLEPPKQGLRDETINEEVKKDDTGKVIL